METGLVSYDTIAEVGPLADLINDVQGQIIRGEFDPPIIEDEFIDNVIGTVNP